MPPPPLQISGRPGHTCFHTAQYRGSHSTRASAADLPTKTKYISNKQKSELSDKTIHKHADIHLKHTHPVPDIEEALLIRQIKQQQKPHCIPEEGRCQTPEPVIKQINES